jgi:hypothetical protein
LPSINLNRVILSGNGVRGSFSDVLVEQTEVVAPSIAGLALTSFRTLWLQDVTVSQSGGVGVSAMSPEVCTARLVRVKVLQSQDTGLRLVGDKCDGLLTEVEIDGAGGFGVDFDSWKNASLSASMIRGTRSNRVGWYGDGVHVRNSNVAATNIQSNYNARAGVSAFGCAPAPAARIFLKSSFLLGNPIDVNVETEVGFSELEGGRRLPLRCEKRGRGDRQGRKLLRSFDG